MMFKHGLSRSPEYRALCHMKFRCYNKNYSAYHLYGGRGITVCDRWLKSFENFYKDMGPRPSKNHSIDRIDNDKGYYKENCRWATTKEQTTNRRPNRMIEINGITKCLSHWCDDFNIERTMVLRRIQKGMDVLTALTFPKRTSGSNWTLRFKEKLQ